MKTFIQTPLCSLCLFLISFCLNAQDESVKKPDSTSNQQVDSTVAIVKNWQLDEFLNRKEAVYDSLWNHFYIVNPIYKQDFSYTYTANIGAPYLNNIFCRQKDEHDFFFLNPFYTYLHKPVDFIYFNTKRPFSYITYSTSNFSKNMLEQTLKAVHTQNVNEFLNIGFIYDLYSDRGQFKGTQRFDSPQGYRRSRLSNISLFSSYEKENYNIYGNLNLNKVGPYNENGGVMSDELVTDTVIPSEEIEVKLNQAKVDMSYHHYYIGQSLKIDSLLLKYFVDDTSFFNQNSFELVHQVDFQRSYRLYKDNQSTNDEFYENSFINPNETFDSTYFRSFRNKMFVNYSKVTDKMNLGTSFGIVLETQRYSHMKPTDTMVFNENDTLSFDDKGEIIWYNEDTVFNKIINRSLNKNYFKGNIAFNEKEEFSGEIGVKYFFDEYRRNDYKIDLKFDKLLTISDKKINGRVSFSAAETTKSYFYQHYTSNHFMWNHSLNKELRFDVKTELKFNEMLTAELNFTRLKNYVYFNESSIPAQHEDWLGIYTAVLDHHLNAWKFHIKNSLAYQYATNAELIRIPDLILNHSTYFQSSVVENALKAQIGFNLKYHTTYHGPAYNPSMGMYHLQDEKKYGNYPVLDVFVNALWKRTRILLKYEHLNSAMNLTGLNDFSALHYPHYYGVFKIAIGWSFYN